MNYCEHSYTSYGKRVSTLKFKKVLQPLLDSNLKDLAKTYNASFITTDNFQEDELIYEISFTDENNQEKFSEQANDLIDYYTKLSKQNVLGNDYSKGLPVIDVFLKLSKCTYEFMQAFNLFAPWINFVTQNGQYLNDYEKIQRNSLIFLATLSEDELRDFLPENVLNSLDEFSNFLSLFQIGKTVAKHCKYNFYFNDKPDDTLKSELAKVVIRNENDCFCSNEESGGTNSFHCN